MKFPSELRGGRHDAGAEQPLPDTRAVVVAEDEHLVLDDGAAGGYAELVAPQRRDGLAWASGRSCAHRTRCCAEIPMPSPCNWLVPDLVTTLITAPPPAPKLGRILSRPEY